MSILSVSWCGYPDFLGSWLKKAGKHCLAPVWLNINRRLSRLRSLEVRYLLWVIEHDCKWPGFESRRSPWNVSHFLYAAVWVKQVRSLISPHLHQRSLDSILAGHVWLKRGSVDHVKPTQCHFVAVEFLLIVLQLAL